MKSGFFKDVLGTRFGSLESEKIIIRSLELEKIGSLESEKRVPAGPYRAPNILLQKNPE